jgi:hypothetical protein
MPRSEPRQHYSGDGRVVSLEHHHVAVPVNVAVGQPDVGILHLRDLVLDVHLIGQRLFARGGERAADEQIPLARNNQRRA